MATAKIALSSVMDAATSAANSVGAVFSVTTKGIGMLDAIVTKVSNEQKLRHKAGGHTFVKNLIRESAEAEAIANLNVLDFCNKSEQHKELFESAFNEFSAILMPQPKASE